jgi:hypothetical protein
VTLLLALLACTSAKPHLGGDDSADTSVPLVDPDGDGFLPPEDCDDTRGDVFPGAYDANGDGVDADCTGGDGTAFVACSPVDVPDVYPTIADAIAAGDPSICLGEGTFTMGELPKGARIPGSLHGQGPGATIVVDPAATYSVSVLEGLTATGIVTGPGSFYYTSVTIEGSPIDGFDNFSCERCALIDSPVEMYVNENTRGVVLVSTWIHGAEAGVHLVTEGCDDESCPGFYCDLRVNSMTFTGNGTAFAMDLHGSYNVYFDVENSIFLDQTEAVLTIDHTGSRQTNVVPSGNGNLVWGTEDAFPDGSAFSANERDPELDLAFAPPLPLEGSPAVDSAGSEASAVDYWGHLRKDPDKGAVER